MFTFSMLEQLAGDPDALIYIRDTDGRYLWVNGGYERNTGMLLQDVLGKTNRDLYGTEAASWELADDLAWSTDAFIVLEETRLNPATGRYQRFVSLKLPITIGGEEYLAGISVEVTNSRSAEHERRLAMLRAKLISAVRVTPVRAKG